jgi:superfamily II DNA or RNA helicase
LHAAEVRLPSSLDDLLAAVREACRPGIWSQGVKLAREGAVFDRRVQGDAVTARVRAPGAAVAPTVTLYPEDREWTCDCGGKVDPCAHVAAAAIAAAPAPASASAPASVSASAPASVSVSAPASASVSVSAPAPVSVSARAPAAAATEPLARLRYRLRHQPGGLGLERWLVLPGGREEPVRGPIARLRLPQGVALLPTREDLTLDRFVGNKQFGYLPADRIAEIFAALAGALDVRVEDRPVSVSAERIVPRAEVIDHPGGGVELVIERDPRVTEVLTAGIALSGDTVHLMGQIELSGGRLERLPLRRAFSRPELGHLVTQVLPDLGRRIPVEVRTRRLPATQRGARPRILFQLDQRGHTLSVVPCLVYGDPPQARVEDGGLVHLQGPAPLRDEAAERALLGRLRHELSLVPGRCVDFNGPEAVRFAARLQAWAAREGGEEHQALFAQASLTPRITLDDRRFDVVFELHRDGADDTAATEDLPSGGAETASPAAEQVSAAVVVQAWQEGLPLVPLPAGGWAPLPSAWLERYGQHVVELLGARRDDGEIATAALPALAAFCDTLERPRPPSFERLAPLLDQRFDAIPEAPLPPDLAATLRPYQRRGVSWLCFLRDAGLGAILADDMGLGKTLQALCALRGRALIVCPRSVVHNWAEEIRRFRPGLRYSTYHGPKRALDPAADVTLTTYALLRNDAEILAREAWGTVVLDEAQAIKNPDSQATRAAYALRADFAISLSGTPVENRLEDLWSQMHFTNRGLLGGYSDFQERYARPIAAGQPGVSALLRQKIRPFVLRRMKREVEPELPPRCDAVLYCELDDEERGVYEAVLAATRKDVVARLAEGAGVLAALEALLRLRQAACHPALLPGQTAAGSSKVERLIEALADAAADGHKALVFSQWTSLLDLLEPHVREAGIGFTRLDGSTRDRASVVSAFQDPAGPPVLLISLKAGGTGLNLTAADHVFLMDPWWNPAVEDQAADRAHRIGQDRPVMVYRLVAKDTVEEGILALQSRKRALAEAALGEADRAAGLTREDLLALLQ